MATYDFKTKPNKNDFMNNNDFMTSKYLTLGLTAKWAEETYTKKDF